MVTMRPQPAVDHVGHGGLEAMEGAGQVDRHHAFPVLDADVEEVHEAFDAGTGHHDLDPAERLAHLVQRGLDAGPVGDVDRHAQRGEARRVEVLGHPLGRVGVDVEDCHLAPLAGQVVADGHAHARATAGHHRGAAHVRPTCCHCRPPTRAAAEASGSRSWRGPAHERLRLLHSHPRHGASAGPYRHRGVPVEWPMLRRVHNLVNYP